MSALRSFRVHIILWWGLAFTAVVSFEVTETYLLGIISWFALIGIRHLIHPRFPELSQTEQIVCAVSVVLFFASIYLVPSPMKEVIGWALGTIGLFWVGYSDYRLFVSSGSPNAPDSGTCSATAGDA